MDDDLEISPIMENGPTVKEFKDDGYTIKAKPQGQRAAEEYKRQLTNASILIVLDPVTPIAVGEINVTVIGGVNRTYTVETYDGHNFIDFRVS